MFKLISQYLPDGDQPKAISSLVKGIKDNKKDQVLLGVTGSGKTFTMANIIADLNKPALVMAHNKTLAAQLYGEMKSFFPENAVEYFVSYYDYYQPEAYIAKSDTYIEKDSKINEQIDLLRHSATRSLIERRDVIVVASVSCIYGLGSPELYSQMTIEIKKNDVINQRDFISKLILLQYERNDLNFTRGHFRVKGDVIDIFPSHLESRAWRVNFFGDDIDSLTEFDPLTGKKLANLDKIVIYANSHFVTPKVTILKAIEKIKAELKDRIKFFEENNQLVEAQRIRQRTEYDIEMMIETGTCKGIENYSRYLSGRNAGDPPPTLFEYLPKDALLFVDESHVTTPQINGMYAGDRSRKESLVSYGFRLPSALDNRPLTFAEWENMRPHTIFVSATPGKIELEKTAGEVIEQIIRPTGLVDPEYEIRPLENQVDDLIGECKKVVAKGYRILVTTLTKKMAEDLSDYMSELGMKVTYLHSDIKTLERIDIISNLRQGKTDILIGVNLLREGLDIPECGLVAIMDADKPGFLRSETSLIQTIGRAARNIDSNVILYADNMTEAMKKSLSETDRRRKIQIEHNKKHNITPKTISKEIRINEFDLAMTEFEKESIHYISDDDIADKIKKLEKEMLDAASDMEFEKAAKIRDKIMELKKLLLA